MKKILFVCHGRGLAEQAQVVYERLLALNMPEAQARAVAFG